MSAATMDRRNSGAMGAGIKFNCARGYFLIHCAALKENGKRRNSAPAFVSFFPPMRQIKWRNSGAMAQLNKSGAPHG